jgi:hypothetical protein
VAAILVALWLVGVPATSADAGVAINEAPAFTYALNRNEVRVAFDVRTDRGPYVVASNRAVARSMSCDGCNTVAIAVQIDLVSGPTRRLNATNSAEARTTNCIACNVLASATQFVVAPGVGVHLTEPGATALAQAHARLDELASSGMSAIELQPLVDSVLADIQAVLQTEVVADQAPAVAADAVTSASPAATPMLPVMRSGGTVVARRLTDLQLIG